MAAPCWNPSPESSTACHGAQLSMPGSLGEGTRQSCGWRGAFSTCLQHHCCNSEPINEARSSVPAQLYVSNITSLRQLEWTRKLRSSCKARLQTPECSLPALSSVTPPPFNLTGSGPPFHPSCSPPHSHTSSSAAHHPSVRATYLGYHNTPQMASGGHYHQDQW